MSALSTIPPVTVKERVPKADELAMNGIRQLFVSCDWERPWGAKVVVRSEYEMRRVKIVIRNEELKNVERRSEL